MFDAAPVNWLERPAAMQPRSPVICCLDRRFHSMRAFSIFAAAALLAAGALAQGRGNQQQRPGAPPQAAPGQSEAPATQVRRGPPAEEHSSVTHHKSRVGGQDISYSATAATYVIKADDGTPKATIFFVSYVKDDVADVSRRPLSFVYNGG